MLLPGQIQLLPKAVKPFMLEVVMLLASLNVQDPTHHSTVKVTTQTQNLITQHKGLDK